MTFCPHAEFECAGASAPPTSVKEWRITAISQIPVARGRLSPPQPLHELEGVTGRICHEEAPDARVRGILRRLEHLYSSGGGAAVPRVNVLDDPRDHHRLRRGGIVEAVALLDGPDRAPS